MSKMLAVLMSVAFAFNAGSAFAADGMKKDGMKKDGMANDGTTASACPLPAKQYIAS